MGLCFADAVQIRSAFIEDQRGCALQKSSHNRDALALAGGYLRVKCRGNVLSLTSIPTAITPKTTASDKELNLSGSHVYGFVAIGVEKMSSSVNGSTTDTLDAHD